MFNLGFGQLGSQGGSVFSPISLFNSGENGAWFTPSDLATLFQDSAGTTAVAAVNDPVGLMSDVSGNDNDAEQSNNALRPDYKQQGLVNWIDFSGSEALVVSFGSSLGSACTIAYAVVDDDPVILTGQTVGSTYSITADNAEFIILDRALTALEEDRLFNYLKAVSRLRYEFLLEYLSISNIHITPVSTFAVANSTDVLNNKGWLFL